jgi:hypothetical protein
MGLGAKGIMGIMGAVSGLFGGSSDKLREIRTDEEINFEKQLKARSKSGTIPVADLQQTMGRSAYQSMNMQNMALQGRMMNQGLGSSIVTQELMRRTDRDTLSYLADEARRISMANEMSKLKAQDQLGEYGMMRSNRLMNIAQANAQSSGGGLLGDLLGTAGSISELDIFK